jgi:hypothetical protein
MTSTKTLVVVAGLVLSAIAGEAAIYNTGIGKTAGETDANWMVTLPSESTSIPATVVNQYYYAWLPNDVTSKWISHSAVDGLGPNPNVSPDHNETFSYQLAFTSSAGVSPISWISDNTSTLFLDGHSVAEITTDQSFWGKNEDWKTVNLNLTPGSHTIRIDVVNLAQNGGNPEGLRVLFAPVPEPSTYLAGIGALGMLCLAGFRNHK